MPLFSNPGKGHVSKLIGFNNKPLLSALQMSLESHFPMFFIHSTPSSHELQNILAAKMEMAKIFSKEQKQENLSKDR